MNIIPKFMYGTAWKEGRTSSLVTAALNAGFREFDTANQRKHYFEAGMGEAIQAAIVAGQVYREELFIQTKFTYQRGQDHRLPYDPAASLSKQVEQSFASSLEHLHTDYVDAYILHGPVAQRDIYPEDKEVWRAMELLHDQKIARTLGVSNVSLQQLELLFEFAKVKPKFVQNRCYAVTRWDSDVRRFCKKNDIIYQGFSLLTANQQVLTSGAIVKLAEKYKTGAEQIVFRFAQQIGMCPLTGTSNSEHMKADLASAQFSLTAAEMTVVENTGV